MKTSMKFTAVVALMFVSLKSMANDLDLYLVADKDYKSMVFHMDVDSRGGQLKLMDNDDNIIYSEEISDVGVYNKRFDLSSLESGFYFLKIENALKTVTYNVNVDKVKVKVVERKEITKPVFKNESGIVFLNVLNLNKDAIKIKIYDSSNRLVFSEVRIGETVVEKAFNFRKAFNDTYTIAVENSKNTYYENVIVK